MLLCFFEVWEEQYLEEMILNITLNVVSVWKLQYTEELILNVYELL